MKIRNSNIELLRIISMFFIVVHHFYLNNFDFTYNELTINQFCVQFLSTFGKVGVNIFVLITGYYMVDNKISIKKLFKLVIDVIIYSYGIMILLIVFFRKDYSIGEIIKCVFPISYVEYWFITTYIMLYIFSYFINKFIETVSKKDLQLLLVICTLLFVLIPSIINGKIECSNLMWFVYLYFLGAYIKKYSINISKKNLAIILICAILLSLLSVFILDKFYNILHFNPIHFAMPQNQILVIIISLSIFLIFEKLNIWTNKFVNICSSGMLGVYLIHCHIMLRDVIWYDIFDVCRYANSKNIIWAQLWISLIIMVVCTTIDLIKQKIFNAKIDKLYDYLHNRFYRKEK